MSPRWQLVIAAVLFSTAGAAIKLAHFTGWQVLCFRAAIALVTILVLIPESRRGWSWRTALVGAGYGATTTLFVLANKSTTAANTVFLQNTSPLFILALAPWLLGERVTRRDLAYMTVLAVGMLLFFAGTPRRFTTAPHPVLGNVLAAGSALTWALTVIGYRWLARRGVSIAAAAVAGNLLACLWSLPLALPVGPSQAADWLIVSYLGVFQLGVAYVFLSGAIPRVTALDASLALLLEPVLNPIWAWWLHRETLTLAALGGGAIILAATVARSRREARPGAVPLPTEAA
ncbi:MAG: DMT family transporter [Gemmatimonadales bacterium]